MSPLTREARQRTLDLVDQARALLNEAAVAACPLKGWAKHYQKICKHSDQTEALWWSLEHALYPLGHDQDGKEGV